MDLVNLRLLDGEREPGRASRWPSARRAGGPARRGQARPHRPQRTSRVARRSRRRSTLDRDRGRAERATACSTAERGRAGGLRASAGWPSCRSSRSAPPSRAARQRLAEDPAIAGVAERHGATPSQVALAWLLQRARAMLLIPGTSSVAHLEENMAAADVALDAGDVGGAGRRLGHQGAGTSSTDRARRQVLRRRGGTARSTRTTAPSPSSQCRSSAKRIPNVCTERVRGSRRPSAGGSRRKARPIRRSRKVRGDLHSPAEADLGGHRLQRAERQPRAGLGRVVAAGRDVVGRVGVEQRREVLDLPAARPELELPAAVGADAVLGAGSRRRRTARGARRSATA